MSETEAAATELDFLTVSGMYILLGCSLMIAIATYLLLLCYQCI